MLAKLSINGEEREEKAKEQPKALAAEPSPYGGWTALVFAFLAFLH